RVDGHLIVNPGIIVKSDGTRIESEFGGNVTAEGLPGIPVVFTSRGDDRYGASGTFDSNNDGASEGAPGDWSGLYARPGARLSLDNAIIAYAGGFSQVGGTNAGFNAIELHQADARIANSRFEFIADGTGGLDVTRASRGVRDATIIFVAGAQPVIVGNTFIDNLSPNMAMISIDSNSLTNQPLNDFGRQTGTIDLFQAKPGNFGPLIEGNAIETGGLAGLRVRGDFTTRQVVLDDVDITHVIDGSIIATDLHHDGGVRLESDADASLVVKFSPGSQIVAGGVPLDIDDRIGGIVQIVGTPGFPVVLTSLDDDSIGAGFDPSGSPLRDTRSDGLTVGRPGQWAGITFTEFTHDRNVATILEREESIGGGGDLNASIDNAQTLGQLAAREKASDENLRLGFSVFGQIAEPGDVDTFGFRGTGGDTVWIDLDRTASTLDTMLEIIDGQGRVLASNNDSHDNGVVTTAFGTDANVMLQSAYSLRNRISDTPRDLYTTNVTDSGLRLILPGTEGVVQQYYARVTGRDGSTGVYELQIRGRELDEHAGSTVRNAEIRFAAAGITVEGGPIHSALVGEGRTVT
ncbi:MAG: hypothetical protein AAFP69_21625, partial [Planctomycetota bacterium]